MTDESQITSAPLPEPAELRRMLVERFNLDELRSLCQDLKIDYDSLPGEGKEAKARELIAYCQRHERIPELPAAINRAKPEPPTPGDCPFKGLQYFDEADADLFFGREQLTARLVERLRQDRFLAVVGASGSGKSSIVRAGLVPCLRRDKTWAISIFAPGSIRGPFYALASALLPLLEPKMTETDLLIEKRNLAKALRQEDLSIPEVVECILQKTPNTSKLLLIVDQFEELFSLHRGEAECKAFVNCLLPATTPEMNGQTTVLIALRADFYAHCARFENLRETLAKHQEYIGPMNPEELRRAIEEPAKRGSYEFELRLVDLFIRDAGNEPGALPLLSHALLETWKRRSGCTLTLAGYIESGGVQGAVAKTAETVFNERLSIEQRDIARNIFLRLTALGNGAPDARRRAALTELVSRSEDAPAVEAVVKTLTDARLITTAQGTVEIAHEALIREWSTLRDWLAQDREGLRIQRRLTDAASEWEKNARDESYLYRGARLDQANKWNELHVGKLNKLEQEFLDTSRTLLAKEMARRRVWQGISAIVGLFVLLLAVREIVRSGIIPPALYKLSSQLPFPSCSGDLSGLMPPGWEVVNQIQLNPDLTDKLWCVVLYRVSKSPLVYGAVYHQGTSPSTYLYPLNLPTGFYLGRHKVSVRMADVLSGNEGPELLIEDEDPAGNTVEASIFGWRDSKTNQPGAPPDPKEQYYELLGWFMSDGGVKVEQNNVTVIDPIPASRSLLAYQKLYVPNSQTKSYYLPGDGKLVDPEKNLISLVECTDPNAVCFPENTVLAFYQAFQDDSALEGLMTPEAFQVLKIGKLKYGCSPNRSQVDRAVVQDITIQDAQSQVTITKGQCISKDGKFMPMPRVVWVLERNNEGRWLLTAAK